jgi:hypothetical protein
VALPDCKAIRLSPLKKESAGNGKDDFCVRQLPEGVPRSFAMILMRDASEGCVLCTGLIRIGGQVKIADYVYSHRTRAAPPGPGE